MKVRFSLMFLPLLVLASANDRVLQSTMVPSPDILFSKVYTTRPNTAVNLEIRNDALEEICLQQTNIINKMSIAGILLVLVIIALIYSRHKAMKKASFHMELQRDVIGIRTEKLQELLTEKNWLLKEIHHRVKNDLQIVLNLLSIQSQLIDDDMAMTALKDSQSRIHTMALIHKKLYQSENVVTVDMPNYVLDLIGYFKRFFKSSRSITFKTDIDAIILETAQAVPLGLILSEAITNAIKHAFPGEKVGEIAISLKKNKNGMVVLTVSDDGIGVSEMECIGESSLGIKLIRGFAGDLNAQVEIKNKDGFSITVVFDQKVTERNYNQLSHLSA